MNFAHRLQLAAQVGLAAFKALPRMQHSGTGGFSGGDGGLFPRLFASLPGSQDDLAKRVGDPTGNSAVSICLHWIADQFPEPELQVVRGEQDEPVRSHPLAQLIENPNPYYDADALWAATIISYCVDGNAYWIKARSDGGYGRPLELWYVPHWQIEPRWPRDGSQFLSHYLHRVEGRETVLMPEDVVHFRFGIDPKTRKGISRLKAVLRSIWSDNEADQYTASILANMGIPGVMIAPKGGDDLQLTKEQRETLEEVWTGKFTGSGRGKPFISSIAVELIKASLSPEEMALDKLRHVPLERICAALRIPPPVLFLSTGSGASAFDNGGQHRAARESAYEECILPLQKRLAAALNRQLLPDLGSPDTERVRWDYSQVRAMQEDEDAIAKRAVLLYRGGLVKRNEGRTMVSLEEDAGGDEYFTAPAPAAGPGGEPKEPKPGATVPAA